MLTKLLHILLLGALAVTLGAQPRAAQAKPLPDRRIARPHFSGSSTIPTPPLPATRRPARCAS